MVVPRAPRTVGFTTPGTGRESTRGDLEWTVQKGRQDGVRCTDAGKIRRVGSLRQLHYLQSCSLHQQARQQIWPACVSLKTKLWGSARDLFLTPKYAALKGERI